MYLDTILLHTKFVKIEYHLHGKKNIFQILLSEGGGGGGGILSWINVPRCAYSQNISLK